MLKFLVKVLLSMLTASMVGLLFQIQDRGTMLLIYTIVYIMLTVGEHISMSKQATYEKEHRLRRLELAKLDYQIASVEDEILYITKED